MTVSIYASVTELTNTYDGDLQAAEFTIQRRDDDEVTITFRGKIPKGVLHDALRECEIKLPTSLALPLAAAITAVAQAQGETLREIRGAL